MTVNNQPQEDKGQTKEDQGDDGGSVTYAKNIVNFFILFLFFNRRWQLKAE